MKEIATRAGLRATDNTSILRSNYRHLTSGKVADAFIDGGGHLSVTDALPTSGLQHPKFMVDVTVQSPIATNGTWDGHSNAEGTWTSTALLSREAHKFAKHEGNYAALNVGFRLPCPCCVNIWSSARHSFDSSPCLLLLKLHYLLNTARISTSATSARMSSLA